MAQVAAVGTEPDALAKQKKRLLEIIKQKSLFTDSSFKLASGVISDYYVDLRLTTLDAEGAALISEIVYAMLRGETDVDFVGGLEMGSVPIIASVCARSWCERPISGFVVRKEGKAHGTGKRIDGNFKPRSTVIILEDVTTKGGSVMQAVRAVRERGATIKKVITIVDRLEGATENLRKEGLELVSVFTTDDFRSK